MDLQHLSISGPRLPKRVVVSGSTSTYLHIKKHIDKQNTCVAYVYITKLTTQLYCRPERVQDDLRGDRDGLAQASLHGPV